MKNRLFWGVLVLILLAAISTTSHLPSLRAQRANTDATEGVADKERVRVGPSDVSVTLSGTPGGVKPPVRRISLRFGKRPPGAGPSIGVAELAIQL